MNLTEMANEVLEPLGFEVLKVRVRGRGAKRRVHLRIDRLDEEVVSVDDVSRASEVFGLELDRLDPFAEAYHLVVESPGPERPLFRPRHFERFSNLATRIRTSGETFRGTIRNVDGRRITFDVAGQTRSFDLDDIISACLDEWPERPR